jgi:hypothetical protein
MRAVKQQGVAVLQQQGVAVLQQQKLMSQSR